MKKITNPKNLTRSPIVDSHEALISAESGGLEEFIILLQDLIYT